MNHSSLYTLNCCSKEYDSMLSFMNIARYFYNYKERHIYVWNISSKSYCKSSTISWSKSNECSTQSSCSRKLIESNRLLWERMLRKDDSITLLCNLGPIRVACQGRRAVSGFYKKLFIVIYCVYLKTINYSIKLFIITLTEIFSFLNNYKRPVDRHIKRCLSDCWFYSLVFL